MVVNKDGKTLCEQWQFCPPIGILSWRSGSSIVQPVFSPAADSSTLRLCFNGLELIVDESKTRENKEEPREVQLTLEPLGAFWEQAGPLRLDLHGDGMPDQSSAVARTNTLLQCSCKSVAE